MEGRDSTVSNTFNIAAVDDTRDQGIGGKDIDYKFSRNIPVLAPEGLRVNLFYHILHRIKWSRHIKGSLRHRCLTTQADVMTSRRFRHYRAFGSGKYRLSKYINKYMAMNVR